MSREELDLLVKKYVSRNIFGLEGGMMEMPYSEDMQKKIIGDASSNDKIFSRFKEFLDKDRNTIQKFIETESKNSNGYLTLVSSDNGTGIAYVQPDYDLIAPLIKEENERLLDKDDLIKIVFLSYTLNDSNMDNNLKLVFSDIVADSDVVVSMKKYMGNKNSNSPFVKDLKVAGVDVFENLNEDLKVFYQDIKSFDLSQDLSKLDSYKKCMKSISLLNELSNKLIEDKVVELISKSELLNDPKLLKSMYNEACNAMFGSELFPKLIKNIKFQNKDGDGFFVRQLQKCYNEHEDDNEMYFSNKKFKEILSEELNFLTDEDEYDVSYYLELVETDDTLKPNERKETIDFFKPYLKTYNAIKEIITDELERLLEDLDASKDYKEEETRCENRRGAELFKKAITVMSHVDALSYCYEKFCQDIDDYSVLEDKEKEQIKSYYDSLDISFDDIYKSPETTTALTVTEDKNKDKEREPSFLDEEYIEKFFAKDFDEYFSRVIGQSDAMQSIRSAIEDVYLNRVQNKPLASLMFLGPTGVGKSMTAKIISDYLFDDDSKIYKIQMQQNAEDTNWQFIGSPTGYVGSSEKPDFIKFIEKNPNGGVIVLEEFEKASDVAKRVFMQMLDEGKLTDVKGIVHDISNFVIIATTNAVTDKNVTKIGFSTGESVNEDQATLRESMVKAGIEREVQGRFSVPVYFKALNKDDIKEIGKLEVNKYLENKKTNCKKLFGQEIDIKVEDLDAVCTYIAENATSADSGARLVLDFVKNNFDPKVNVLIKNKAKQISISIKDGALSIVAKEPKTAQPKTTKKTTTETTKQ